MLLNKIVISNEAPSIGGVLWAKPVEDGFTLYALINGGWKPFKLADSNSPASTKNTTEKLDKANLVKAVKKAIVGRSSDTKDDITLYGLKAYINDALNNLG